MSLKLRILPRKLGILGKEGNVLPTDYLYSTVHTCSNTRQRFPPIPEPSVGGRRGRSPQVDWMEQLLPFHPLSLVKFFIYFPERFKFFIFIFFKREKESYGWIVYQNAVFFHVPQYHCWFVYLRNFYHYWTPNTKIPPKDTSTKAKSSYRRIPNRLW